MSKKAKKHRLVIEFTTSHPVTEGEAVRGLQLLLDTRLDLQKGPIWLTREVYGEKLVVKSWRRVLSSLVNY